MPSPRRAGDFDLRGSVPDVLLDPDGVACPDRPAGQDCPRRRRMNRRIPELRTQRLLIRELTMHDLETINDVLNEAYASRVSLDERERWLHWTVLGYEMFARLEQPHYGERAVVSPETEELLGVVGIVPYLAAASDAPEARATPEVGLFWAISPDHQGNGYAAEAARAVVDYLFTQERLGRIIATTGYDNLPSQKVMEKLGMTIHRIGESQPDQFVVGLLENRPT